MKKFKNLLFSLTIFFIFNNLQAGYGSGDLKLTDQSVYDFHDYLKGKLGKPERFFISIDGRTTHWWYCPYSECAPMGDTQEAKKCEARARTECGTFAVGRSVKWKNGINPGGKEARFSSKDSIIEVREKLAALGFYGTNTSISSSSKNYRIGKRSFAMNWSGYNNLIKGEIEFKEKEKVGALTLKLPNNDGKCEGTYALSTNQGTWSLLCSNDMNASGNLVLDSKDGSVAGRGKDSKGNGVTFRVNPE